MNISLPDFSDLQKRHIRTCLKIKNQCRKILAQKKVILAISGGCDSTALAIIMYYLRPMLDLEIYAFHLDHCLRPESARDAQWVKNFCSCLHFPLKVCQCDVNLLAKFHGCGIEEAGRIARYSALRDYQAEIGAELVLVAHHADDLGEDIIMRLTRGCGWPGLGGMKVLDNGILRPLLYENRAYLEKLLSDLEIPWLNDATNIDPKFMRNRMRHNILPLLRRENPSISRNFINLNHFSDIDENFWRNYLEEALQSNPWIFEKNADSINLVLPASLLSSLPPAARLRLFFKALRFLAENTDGGQARMKTIFQLDEAYEKKIGGKLFQLPGNLNAFLNKGSVTFLKNIKS